MRGRYADDALVAAAIGWDVRNWSRAIPLWQRQIDIRRPRNALAIGERGGGLSLWLASQGIEVCAAIWACLSSVLERCTRVSASAD